MQRTGGRLHLTRALLCAVLLLPCGCVYISRHTPPGACRNDLGSPVRNFCVVAPGVLWRGERPDIADARWLLEHGVGTVVSIQEGVRRSFEAARVTPGLVRSVPYFRLHFRVWEILTHAHLDEEAGLVLAIIRKAPRPVYISCRAGVDRTGLMAAAYRVLVDHVSRRQAIAEMERFHSPWDPLNARYVRTLSGTRAAQILRNATQWKNDLRPVGRFVCTDGRCPLQRASPRSAASLSQCARSAPARLQDWTPCGR